MTDKTAQVGDLVKFKGYAEAPADPILAAGEIVKVRVINADGGMVVDQLDAEGNVRTDVTDAETLFMDEIEFIEADGSEAAASEGKTPATAAETGEAAAPETTETAPKAAKGKKGKGSAIKPSKTDKSKGEQVAISPTDDNHTGPSSDLVRAAIASVAGENAEDRSAALLAAKALVNRVDETYYTLGGVLAYIKESGVYKSLGYDGKRGFADYCKAELGTDYRKAQYLIDVFDKVQAAGLNEKRLAEIGWSKAVQIVRVGDVSLDKLREDFDDLIDFAKANTRDDLISHIKTTYEGVTSRNATGGGTKVNTLVFHASAEEAEQMERALANAKRLAGTDDANAALRYILNDWLMMTDGVEIDQAVAIATVEAKFGITLAVVEPEASGEQAEEVETGQAEAQTEA